MSRATDLFRARVLRRAAALGPDVRRALLKGFENLRRLLGDRPVQRLIESGAFDNIVTERDVVLAFRQLSAVIRSGVEQAASVVGKRDIPGAPVFNTLSPNVVKAIQTLNDAALQGLSATVRDGVRAAVERGLRDGVNPRDIARDLRQIVGLAPNQVEAVANYRGLLEAGDREALSRELRDRRFDGAIERALSSEEGLSEAEIDRMVGAYERKFVSHAAETIARTVTLDAQRVGQQTAWGDAVENGFVDGETLTRRWSGTLDDRERETHLLMEGETVSFDEPYSSGQLYCGEGEFNCRCVDIFETHGTVKEGAGARGIEAGQLRVGGQF